LENLNVFSFHEKEAHIQVKENREGSREGHPSRVYNSQMTEHPFMEDSNPHEGINIES